MALETRYEIKDIIKRIQLNSRLLTTVLSGLRSAKAEQEKIFARGGTAAEIKEKIADTELVTLEAMRDEVEAALTDLIAENKTTSWARVLRIGTPFELHSFIIDVSAKTIGFLDIEGASFNLSEIPFHKAGSDVLEISRASNSAMNGRYTTNACTTGVLTLNETIPGSDISNEKGMIITIRKEFM